MADKTRDGKIYFWLRKCPVSLLEVSPSLISKLDDIQRNYKCACYKCEKLDPEERLCETMGLPNGLGSFKQPALCKSCGTILEAV